MDIEELTKKWRAAAKIDQSKLHVEMGNVPLLHSEFLEFWVYFRAKRSAMQRSLNMMKNTKRRYYRGEMGPLELKENGWEAWQGLKPSQTELNSLYEQDFDIIKLAEKLEYYETAVIQSEYILKAVQARDWQLKAILDLRKFEAGN
jgi:hypothetical protein